MTTPHDRALIAFASDALAIMEDAKDWSSDELEEISCSAENFGLADADNNSSFRIIPRSQFTNPLEL